MQENQMGGKAPEVNVDLENQIRFVEFMLQGYKEPTGQQMLSAIKGSLEKLKELREKL